MTPVAAGIFLAVEMPCLPWFTFTEIQKHSNKTGKLDQVAELSKGMVLYSDSGRATGGRNHTDDNMGWLLNSCKHTGHPAQGLQTDVWS